MDPIQPQPIESQPSPQNSPAPQNNAPAPEPVDFGRQLDDSLRAAFNDAGAKPNELKAPNEKEAKADQTTPKSEEKTDPQLEKKETPQGQTALVDPATVADPKGLKNGEGWKNLKSVAKTNFEIAEKRLQENENLKKSFAVKETDYKKQLEDRDKQIQELSGYRAAVDVQADPEFMEKYEKPIDNLQKELKSMLKSQNVTDDVINQMDFTDSDGMARVLSVLEQNTNQIFARRFARRVEDFLELNDRKIEHIDSWKSNHKEFIEKKKQEALGRQGQMEGQVLNAVEQFVQEKDEAGSPRIAFLNKQEVPSGATKEQAKAIEAHNKVVENMHGKLKEILKADSPQDRAEIAIAALGAQWLKWQLDAANKRLEAKEAELKRISQSGSEGESRTANTNGSGRESRRPTASDPTTLDLETSISSAFPGMK